jgi:L-ascorbate metabolism protein UlaG (beta-lactamase superfamily)
MQLQLIRSATLRLTYAGRQILIDPDFAPQHSRPPLAGVSPNPMVELPLSIEAILNGVELVLVSHLHRDHFDSVAAERVPKDLPLVCQPGDEATIRAKGFRDVTPLTDSLEWRGLRFTRTLGRHGLGDVETMMGKVMGFGLRAEGEPTLYWASDTVWCDEVRAAVRELQPRVIITHSCGARWPNAAGSRELIVMDAAQTVALCQLEPEATVIATHMEAFDHGTITRAALREAAQVAGVAESRLRIPLEGETLRFA